MAFYIKPPSGTENLQNLAVFGKKRLTFLKQVLRCDSITDFRGLLECADTADDSECLIEGTTKDRVSHFLLRLACCQDQELASFCVKAETELFCYRFSSMNSSELVLLLKSTHRFLLKLSRHHRTKRKPHVPGYLQSSWRSSCRDLLKILQGMIAGGQTWDGIIFRYLDESRSEFIQVPFEYVLSLVAGRCVVLERGMARVPIAEMLKVFAYLFERIVSDGMVDARHSVREVMSEDERMDDLFREIRRLYYSGSRITGTALMMECEPVSSDDIDKLSIYFPPCMQHLHRMLRKKHRLRHFSRIQYTLFLKEVGLPVSHAVNFWQREYSQTACCPGDNAGCTHDWKRDSRRYTYSIRHLYGLEGSRVNYRAHSCCSLQECNIGHGEEGGCPFRHFDDYHLTATMSNAGIMSVTDNKQINDLARQGHLQAACHAFFKKSVAVNLKHLLKSTGESDERTDSTSDVQPSIRRISRLIENECQTDVSNDEKGCSTATVQDIILNKRNTTKQINIQSNPSVENTPRGRTLSAKDIPFQGPNCKDPECEGASPTSPDQKTGLSNENMTRYCAGTSGSLIRNTVGSNQEGSIPNKHTTTPHTGSTSTFRRRSVGSNEKATSSQTITFLKEVQIEKPSDYYRSYARLLGSLHQLEESKL